MKNLEVKKSLGGYILAALFGAAAWVYPANLEAASCCGGGSSSNLILPKYSRAMYSFSGAVEVYNGLYDTDGYHIPDPDKSDLRQYRLSLGAAIRLGDRFQLAFSIPYVWNSIYYSGVKSENSGIGDSTIALTYEAFDDIKCVWKVRDWKDLAPATYFTFSLLTPTGISPYSDVQDNFHITGRGFYRGDLKLLLDKSIYTFNLSLSASYGKYFMRPINREYGVYVKPYTKVLGDRLQFSVAAGYTLMLDFMSVTFTGAYSKVQEFNGITAGKTDTFVAFQKNIISFTTAFSSADKNRVLKFSFAHNPAQNGWGVNSSATNTFSFEVWNVIR